MSLERPAVRYYSEKDQIFPLAGVRQYEAWPECRANRRPCHDHCACELVPVLTARDERMWMSVEWAAEHGIPVPDNWRELP